MHQLADWRVSNGSDSEVMHLASDFRSDPESRQLLREDLRPLLGPQQGQSPHQRCERNRW